MGKRQLVRRFFVVLLSIVMVLDMTPKVPAKEKDFEEITITFKGISKNPLEVEPGTNVKLDKVSAEDNHGNKLVVDYKVKSNDSSKKPTIKKDVLTAGKKDGTIYTVSYAAYEKDDVKMDSPLDTKEQLISVISSDKEDKSVEKTTEKNTEEVEAAKATTEKAAEATTEKAVTTEEATTEEVTEKAVTTEEATTEEATEKTTQTATETSTRATTEKANEKSTEKTADATESTASTFAVNNINSQLKKKLDSKKDQIDGIGSLPNGDETYLTKFNLAKNPNNGTLNGFGIKDGTTPWDSNNDPGNDSNAANMIVRTFDTVTYSIEYATAVHNDAEYSMYDQAWLNLEIVLPFSKDQAQLDLNAMSWLENAKTTVSDDGNTQIVTGKYLLVHKDGIENSVPGGGTLEIPIEIYNIANGTAVTPTFKAWMEGNDTEHEDSCAVHHQKEVWSISNGDVKVSSAPSYNVQVKPVNSGYVGGLQNYDFTGTGNSQALNKNAGIVNGRLTAYGVTIQLYNSNPDKGLRGIEYPTGPIQLTLNLESSFRPTGSLSNAPVDVTTEYQPLVWSQGENKPANPDDDRSYPSSCANYAVLAAPGAAPGNTYNYCHQSGDWQGTQTGKTVTLTVKDYEIDGSSFPNADLGYGWDTNIYFDYRTGVRNVGCFSAGKIFVVQPFYNNGKGSGSKDTYILDDTDVLNTGTAPSGGDFFMKLSVKNAEFHSESSGNTPVSNTLSNKLTSDDSRESQVFLSRPGSYDTRIMYGCRTSADYGYDIQKIYGGAGAYANGKDWALPGHSFALRWGCVFNASGNSSNVSYAADSLIKFDSDAIELDPSYSDPANGGMTGNYSNSYYGYSTSFIYAAKPNGTAWTSDDEMNTTTMSQLVYYDSLAALKADNKTCIGVVAQFRRTDTSKPECTIQSLTLSCMLGAKIKDNQDLIGKFYMINTETYQWNKGQYNAISTANGGKFPSQISKATRDAFATTAIGEGNTQMVYHSSPGYKKEALNPETGDYAGNHTGSYQYGDSVQIIGAISSVIKQVEQKQANNNPVNTYNLGDDQRYVDWILTPGMKVEKEGAGSEEAPKTYIVLTDTIPKGLTYKSLSAYWGGNYKQAEKAGRQGSITGGTEIPVLDAEPSKPDDYKCYMILTSNPDGTTTMKIRINDLKVGEEISPVHYTTLIGTPDNPKTDVNNNDEFENIVNIKTPVDKRAINDGNGTISKAGMKVLKLAAVSLQKYAVNKINERTDNLAYTLITANNAALTIDHNMLVDRLPYNDDENGSIIHNGFTLAKMKVDPAGVSAASLSDVKVYATTDESYRSYTDEEIGSNDFRDSEVIPKWTILPVNTATGDVDVSPLGNKQPVMVAVVGRLDSAEIHRVSLEIDPADPQVGDIFVNKLATAGSSTTAKTEFASRSLSGLAWYDANQDGIRDEGEAVFSGVKANLYLWDDSEDAYVFTEKSVTTDSNGKYSFQGLDAGLYSVRFTDSTDTKELSVTKKDATANDEQDSDAAEHLNTGKTRDYAVITGILMPAAKEMDSKTYTSDHHDVGYTNSIWAENKTTENKGGTIQISGYDDTKSTISSDGADDKAANRKPSNKVIAVPDDKWAIDNSSFQIQDTDISLEKDGTFQVTISGTTYHGVVNKNADGSAYLTVTNFEESKKNVNVAVTFIPTIWVENTTTDDKNGKVQVTGDDDSLNNIDSGDRQPKSSVTGVPDQGFIADTENITVNNTKVILESDGSFTLSDGSGNNIKGTVTLQKNGNAVVAIENMSTPIDVGIPFIPSIWVANNTKYNYGGLVEVAGFADTKSRISSDGNDNNSENRKNAVSVSATPDEKWEVDLDKITLNGVTAVLDNTKAFSITDNDGNMISGNVSVNASGKATVTLDALDVPVDVGIPFIPSLWVANNTKDNKGGEVEVVGYSDTKSTISSDGKDNNTTNRKLATSVCATPKDQWVVDLKNIEINGTKIKPDDQGAFSVSDQSGSKISGTVTVDDSGKATVALDEMPVPVDVLIGFVPTTWIENLTTDHKHGKVQITNDNKSLSNTDSGSRVVSSSVKGIPDPGYITDMNHITVNQKVIHPDKDGGFTITDSNGNVIYGTAILSKDGSAIINIIDQSIPVDVGVSFLPSIWVANDTKDNQGGTVQVDGYQDTLSTISSDGNDDNSVNRKYATIVSATPKEGWEVDLSKIVVNHITIHLDKDQKFTITDKDGNIISGRVIIDKSGSALLILDKLEVPVDVEFLFKKSPVTKDPTDNKKKTVTKDQPDHAKKKAAKKKAAKKASKKTGRTTTSNTAKTGDNDMNVWIWLLVLSLDAACMTGVIRIYKKKKS